MSKLEARIISLFPKVLQKRDKVPKPGYPVGFLWVGMIGITDRVKPGRMVRRDSTIGLDGTESLGAEDEGLCCGL